MIKKELNITETEKIKLAEIINRNKNGINVHYSDMNIMMYYYYSLIMINQPEPHIKRQIRKDISCSSCRSKVLIFMENWLNKYENEQKGVTEENK